MKHGSPTSKSFVIYWRDIEEALTSLIENFLEETLIWLGVLPFDLNIYVAQKMTAALSFLREVPHTKQCLYFLQCDNL